MSEEQIIKRDLPHSGEIKRSAKGEYSWNLKMYFETDQADAVLDTLKAIDKKLRETYIDVKV